MRKWYVKYGICFDLKSKLEKWVGGCGREIKKNKNNNNSSSNSSSNNNNKKYINISSL